MPETILILPGVPSRIVVHYAGRPTIEVEPIPESGALRIAEDGKVHPAEMEKNVIILREEELVEKGWMLDKETRKTLIEKTVEERRRNGTRHGPRCYSIAHRLVNKMFPSMTTSQSEAAARDIQKAAERALKHIYNRGRQ